VPLSEAVPEVERLTVVFVVDVALCVAVIV